jgi:beta-phosphoglucomutase
MLDRERSPSITAVIFDLDGVITNTLDFHYRSWQRLMAEEGIDFNDSLHEGILGRNREDSLTYLLGDRRVSAAEYQSLLDRKNKYYLDSIANLNQTNLLPGISELLPELHQSGIKVALGSSSKNAKIVLERLGVIDLFDAIVDGNQISQPKPAPETFINAAKSLGAAPADCLVVEDAAAGVAAALAAQMWVLGVGPKERLQSAHAIFPSLAGIGWQDIVDKIVDFQ